MKTIQSIIIVFGVILCLFLGLMVWASLSTAHFGLGCFFLGLLLIVFCIVWVNFSNLTHGYEVPTLFDLKWVKRPTIHKQWLIEPKPRQLYLVDDPETPPHEG